MHRDPESILATGKRLFVLATGRSPDLDLAGVARLKGWPRPGLGGGHGHC
jgi:hypothetical protein